MTSHQQRAPSASLTTPTDREVHVERVFDAPRDRVFAGFTDPELIPEWWGPRETTTVVDQMDVRAGGSWRFVMRDADGSELLERLPLSDRPAALNPPGRGRAGRLPASAR